MRNCQCCERNFSIVVVTQVALQMERGGLQLQRYFMQFCYLGTRFQGLQRQVGRKAQLDSPLEVELDTVQGALEAGLETLVRPDHPVRLVPSCRTDSGVHALVNTAHVDLGPGELTAAHHNPRTLTARLNGWLAGRGMDIQVNHTQITDRAYLTVAHRCSAV